MQGKVAETVYLVRLAFVDGILPVNLEKPFQNGRYLVHIVNIEGYDADAYKVCDVEDVLVFTALFLKFAGKGALCLYPVLNGRNQESGLFKKAFELLRDDVCHLRIHRQQIPVLLQ